MIGILQLAKERLAQSANPEGVYVDFTMGKGRDTLLHGSVCLKMQCSVGDMHMPESTAIFTMFIH